MLFFQHLSVIPRSWAHIHIKSIRRDKIPTSPNGGAKFRQMGERISAKWGILFFFGFKKMVIRHRDHL